MERMSESLTNLQSRDDVVYRSFQDVASSNASKSFGYALSMNNDPYDSAIRAVADVWARSDPRSALAAVSGIEGRLLRRSLEDSVTYHWADKSHVKSLRQSMHCRSTFMYRQRG